MLFSQPPTRIGIVGYPPEAEPLFHIAADKARAERKCHVQVLWLSGKLSRSQRVDARIVDPSAAKSSRAAPLVRVLSLEGLHAGDALECIRAAIVDILNELAMTPC